MLIDANLPDRSGAATLAEIRSGNGPNRQTVAVLTSADSTIRQSAAHDMGFADVLHKPFALEELRAILDQAMDHGASDRAGISLLDDDQSRQNSGGNDAIAAALRSLFVKELDELPAELDDRWPAVRIFAPCVIACTGWMHLPAFVVRRSWPRPAAFFACRSHRCSSGNACHEDLLAASEQTLAALRDSLELNAPERNSD
jgi:hypothetical protein